MTELKIRTQDEIVARVRLYETGAAEDFLAFAREVLCSVLDFDHVRPWLRAGVTREDWAESQVCGCDIESAARSYYTFALGKIEDHRGISASRSVTKLTEYAWLLCRDDVVDAMEAADYGYYGAPAVKAFGDGFGLPWPAGEVFSRMAAGEPCTPDCGAGCLS